LSGRMARAGKNREPHPCEACGPVAVAGVGGVRGAEVDDQVAPRPVGEELIEGRDPLRPLIARSSVADAGHGPRAGARPVDAELGHLDDPVVEPLARVRGEVEVEGQVDAKTRKGGDANATRVAHLRGRVGREPAAGAPAVPNLVPMATVSDRPAAPQVASEERPPPRPSLPVALLVAMRPGEWIKNI